MNGAWIGHESGIVLALVWRLLGTGLVTGLGTGLGAGFWVLAKFVYDVGTSCM